MPLAARACLSFALIAIAASFARPAQAQPHRVCLYLDLGDLYWDASPRAADGEDFREEYGRNEGEHSFPAQRWLAHISDADAGTSLFGWEPLDAMGCAGFELPGETTTLRLEWVRWALWETEPETGNQLVGYRCEPSMQTCEFDEYRRTEPVDLASGTTSVVVSGAVLQPIDALMWATTFAEERFAAIGEQPLDNTRIYLGHDPQDVLPGWTQADRTFGNQPSVIIDGRSWHSKHTVAHEYGHQQTIVHDPAFGESDIDYCYDASAYPAAPQGCGGKHTFESHEWQPAAAVEGIASWYAVSTWNDVDLVECQNCQPGVRYVVPTGAAEARSYVVPRTSPLCTVLDQSPCPAGVGNEWDWLSAFRLFRLQAPSAPSFRTMFTMLSAAFSTGIWPPSSADESFYDAFDQTMAGHLGPDYPAWQAAAEEMELDR